MLPDSHRLLGQLPRYAQGGTADAPSLACPSDAWWKLLTPHIETLYAYIIRWLFSWLNPDRKVKILEFSIKRKTGFLHVLT